MNAAVVCRKCRRPTLDPSGLCVYHKGGAITTRTALRKIPNIKSSAVNKEYGWLGKETGISISDHFSDESIDRLSPEERFSTWMTARVSVRALESQAINKGFEKARDYAGTFSDTTLALIWERLNHSRMNEFYQDDFRETVVEIVRGEVTSRIESGKFSPMNITGFISDFSDREPQTAATFF